MRGCKARCPHCGSLMVVPDSDEVIDLAVHYEFDRPGESASFEDVDPPAVADDDEAAIEVPGLLSAAVSRGMFQASHPARLRISYLRYILAFPTGFLVTHGALLVALASWLIMGFFSVALVLPASFACFIYWRMLTGKFSEGCVTPGIVLSLDPPRVAASTDLRLADRACHVIKVFEQPLHRKTGTPAAPGMRVATVANYRGMHEDCCHWFTFLPTVAEIVSANAWENERLLASLAAEDWNVLATGLKQLPKAVEPGTWRVFPFSRRRPAATFDDHRLSDAVLRHVKPAKCPNAWPGIRAIPPEQRAVIQRAFPGQVNLNSILAAWIRGGVSDPQGLVLLVLRQGLGVRRPGKKPAFFDWDQIRGAFMGSDETQIVLVNGDRISFDNRGLVFATLAAFENLINEIVQLPADE